MKKLSKDRLSSIIKFAFAVSRCVDFCINEKEIPAAIKNIKEANELLNQAEKQVLQLIETQEPSEKPKVKMAFIWKMVDDSVFILHQERAEFYKKKFTEAGIEVEK